MSKGSRRSPAEWKENGKQWLTSFFTKNWMTKLLAVVFALFFWIFVLSTDSSVTRERTVEIPLTILGEEDLSQSTGLVVSTSRSDIPETVNVAVSTSVLDVMRVSSSTVRATLDLGNVNVAGEKSLLVEVEADGDGWDIKNVEPQTVTLSFDKRATIEVPTQVEYAGELEEGYWKGSAAISPDSITLVASESELEQVERIVCRVDLEGQTSSIEKAVVFEVLDSDGNVIDDANFVDGLPRGVITVPIYPQKRVPVDTSPALISGEFVADGYSVEGLSPSVSQVTIAAPPEVLDSVSSIPITIPRQPGEQSENTESFSTMVSLQLPEGTVWSSYEEISVWIKIGALQGAVVFDEFYISAQGTEEGMTAQILQESQEAQITLTGPESVVSRIRRGDLRAYVDVSNYGVGLYTLPVEVELPEEYADQVDVNVLPSERNVRIMEE